MAKLKTYEVTYRATVKRACTIKAKSEKEARKKFDNSDFDDDFEIDCTDIDDVCINEVEE